MSPTATMREKPAFGVVPDWHVMPTRGGGWRVYDGGRPVPGAEFTRKNDAVKFAREKAAESNAGEPDRGKHRKVVISSRAKYKTEVVGNGIERFVTLPGEPPPRRQFGSMRGQVWMSPDFDDPLEFKGDDE